MQDLTRHLNEIQNQGYTIIQNAIEPELIDELNEALESLETDLNIKPGDNAFEGHNTVRIYNLLAHQAVFRQVPVHTNLLPLIEGVLNAGCLISSLSSIAIDAPEISQPMHVDDALIQLKRPHAAVVCNSMWALTDFTAENGATRIVPGSHKWKESPVYGQHYDSIPAEMPRGSLMVWNGSLWHGGGANNSDKRRVGLAMNYCAGFIRQQENQQLGLSKDTVKQFSPRLLQLIGYGTYNGLIGHINKKSPAQLLLGKDDKFLSVWDAAEERN